MPEGKLLKIRLARNGRPLQAFRFSKDLVHVGRDPDADLILDDPGVSPLHVKLERTPGGCFSVEDLGSSRGIEVNRRSVRRQYLLTGDVVRIGPFDLTVSYEEPARFRITPGKGGQGGAAEAEAIPHYAEGGDEDWPAPELRLVMGGGAPVPLDAEGEPRPIMHVPGTPLLLAMFFTGIAVGMLLTWMLLRMV